MTVKEVFELRKQGKVEEAYEAIRPMYAVHQGKYTTLCMFWTASDILKKRIDERRLAEAAKIFEALQRVLPRIDDRDGKAHSAVLHGAMRLVEADPSVSVLDFLERYGVENLAESDWQGTMSQDGHALPSTAQRLLTCCFHEVRQHPDADHALKVMPLLQEAVRRNPRNKNTQRYMAVVYVIMGERDKAADIYRRLLLRYHDSWLYAELAGVTDDAGLQAALYCKAIQNQRQEQFRMGYRLALARLLLDRDQARAAHELQKCIAARKAQGYGDGTTRDILSLTSRLQGVAAASDAEQADFYRRMADKYQLK